MIGVLGPDEIDALLHRHRVGRLACTANDRPYVVPITYAYDGGCIYAYSGPGRKIETMREQPLVCFEVDEVEGDSEWRSVVVEGRYEEVTDESGKRLALALLGEAEGRDGVGRGLLADGPGVVFKIRLEERSGRFERRDA